MTLRAVIADRNRLVREVVIRDLHAHDIAVVAAVSGGEEMAGVVEHEKPDVAILSDPLQGQPIDELIGAVVHAGCHVIVLSENESEERIVACLSSGASGYLTHDVKPAVIAEAVTSVCRGGAALHGRAARLVLAQWRGYRSAGTRRTVSLTARESEVLAAMVEGLPAKAIGRRLGVSVKTVESHKVRVFDKLGARNQGQAVSIAIGFGLVDPPDPATANPS